MNEFEKSILNVISENPGIKTVKIAQLIGCDKHDIYSVLYGILGSYCYQDSSYRWYIKTKDTSRVVQDDGITPDKCLSDICKYYLNCLSLDDDKGISTFLQSKNSLNYTELSGMVVDSTDEKTAKLIQKVSSEKVLTAHVGYPVLIENEYSQKTKQYYLKIVPILLFPVDISGGAVSVASIPHVNKEIIKLYSTRDLNTQVYDLVQLENELGLNDLEEDDIDLEELVARLQSIREWQWKDTLNPSTISNIPPIETIDQEGIYNKAILIITDKSSYTMGLESELSKLALLDEASYKDTALYDWIHSNPEVFSDVKSEDIPLLEVLPMNSEQEQAIRHSINNKLTIVTGPPGTGKSQVVTNLIVNAAWNGMSVLFTSKNNKAVDVVEARVNSLGCRPVMLRKGGNQYASHLSEQISNLLTYSADPNDQQDYNRYFVQYQEKIDTYQKLKKDKENVMNLRNHADHMEQKVCDLRDKWGKWINSISEAEVNCYEEVFKQFCSAYDIWYRSKNSFWGKLLWFAIGKKKTRELDKCIVNLNEYFCKYEQPKILYTSSTLDSKQHKKIIDIGKEISYALQTIKEYNEALNDLLAVPQFENIDHSLVNIKIELADIAKKCGTNG